MITLYQTKLAFLLFYSIIFSIFYPSSKIILVLLANFTSW